MSAPLARRLTELSRETGRRIGLLVDRRGEVSKVVVGDAHRVFLPDLGRWRADGTDHGSCSGSCPSCSHSGKYGADCSGLIAKAWQFGPVALDTATAGIPGVAPTWASPT